MLKKKPILLKENIFLGLASETRNEAIERGGRLLYESGYVSTDYLDDMFLREDIVSTYIGNGVAIPHGVSRASGLIKSSGLVILQYPNGINYNGNDCYMVIAISGKNNEHIKMLSNIVEQLYNEEEARKLWKTNDLEFVYNLFVNG